MIGEEALLTTAELALALGGFGSVVAAFMGNRKQWEPMEVVRFRALIVISLTAALIALLPVPLFHSGLEASALWIVASTFAAVVLFVVLIGMMVYAGGPMVTHGSRMWSLVAILISILAIAVNVLNALGLGFSNSFTGYFTGLLIQLILAGMYFVRLIALSGPQAKH